MLHKGTLGDYHMAHNPFPFTRDSHPDLTKTIMGVVGAKPVSEGTSPCEKAAAARLRDANVEDLEEYPGKRGAAAHKRLHRTIKSVVGEGVIRDTVQRVRNKLRGAGGRTDAELDAMPKRVFMPANPRAVRQQKLEDSKKPSTTWDSKPDEFGQQRIGAKNADGDVRYFRSSERGRAESWARGRTKHKRAN